MFRPEPKAGMALTWSQTGTGKTEILSIRCTTARDCSNFEEVDLSDGIGRDADRDRHSESMQDSQGATLLGSGS